MLTRSLRLRRILAAYTFNELGTWFGYVALAWAVYSHTGSAIATAALFIARGLIPALAAPLVVARVERVRRRGLLAALFAVQGALTLGLAALVWRFSLAGVLALVAIEGIAAVAATALVRACAAEVARSEPGVTDPEAAQREASAALNMAYMATFAIGPAIGGLLVHSLGAPIALLLDAATFGVCALLLARLSVHVQDDSTQSMAARLRAAWRHVRSVPALRTLLLTEAVAIIFFAAVEPVEVIYTTSTLHSGNLGYGLLVAAWGLGAAVGAAIFARAPGLSLGPALAGGTLLVGLAYLGWGVSPTIGAACGAAVVGGIGNGVQWPAMMAVVQRLTPGPLQGRLMSALGSINALCPAIGFALGGVIASIATTRATMFVAGGVASLATAPFVRLWLKGLPAGDHERPPAEAVIASP